MGEAKKAKCFRFTLATPLAVFRSKSAELNKPRFSIMEFKIELH